MWPADLCWYVTTDSSKMSKWKFKQQSTKLIKNTNALFFSPYYCNFFIVNFFTHGFYTRLNRHTGNHRNEAGQQIDFYCLRLSKNKHDDRPSDQWQRWFISVEDFKMFVAPGIRGTDLVCIASRVPSSDWMPFEWEVGSEEFEASRPSSSSWPLTTCKTEESKLHPVSSHQPKPENLAPLGGPDKYRRHRFELEVGEQYLHGGELLRSAAF